MYSKKITEQSRVYKFSRGTNYSCLVVFEGDFVTFEEIKYPPAVSDSVIDKFLDDAEKYVKEFVLNKRG